MRNAEFISLYAGVLIGLGYLIGSFTRSRTRAQDDGAEFGVAAGAAEDTNTMLRTLGAEIVVTMLWAAISFAIIERLAPGTSAFRNSSAVGFLSSKALTVWESVALWAGLSTLVGFIVPVTSRGRDGSNGLAGAGALLLAYSPVTLMLSAGAFVAGSSAARSSRIGVLAAAASLAIGEWVLSIANVQPGWGLISGPESSLWAAVMAGVLAATTLRERPPVQ